MVDILAFGAHPDDIEFGCGGVLAKMAVMGHSIAMVDLTTGQHGSHGSPEIRKKEGLAAAKVIGAERIFLDFVDCELVDSYEGRLKLVEVIRNYRPKLVLAPQCDDKPNHPDHIACGKMVRYACRYARFQKILPELPIHCPEGILYYLHPIYEHADFIVDVSDHVDTWVQMMQCYVSQHKTKNYTDINLQLASKFGVMIDKNYAQGFSKNNPVVVDSLMTITKGTIEL